MLLDTLQIALRTVVEVSVCAGAIVVISLVIQKTLGRRWSPRITAFLWLLVLLRFVLFVTPESPTSVFNLFQNETRPVAIENLVVSQSSELSGNEK